MSSPNPPHSVKLEMFVNGAWTDISADDYQRQPFSITRGYSSESSKKVDPARLTGLLDNRSKNYSPRNPTGTYYPTLKQNTPIRVSVASGGTNYRFWGELAGLVPSADQSGRDLTSTLEAGGVLRRLGTGAAPVQSRPRSYLPTTSPSAYWPLEDGALSTQGVPVVGANAFYVAQSSTPQIWGTNTLTPWLAPTVAGYRATLDTILYGPAPGAAGAWALDWMATAGSPFTIAVSSDVANPATGGSQWTFSYTPSISSILISPPAGGPGSQSFTYTIPTTVGHHFRMAAQVSGADVALQVYLDGLSIISTTFVAGAPLPAPVGVVFNPNSGGTNNTQGVTFGHIAAWWSGATAPSIANAYAASQGAPGELVTDRLTRICAEQSITLTLVGTDNRPCGPQYVMAPVDILQETADVGGGFLYETLDSVGLTYRTRDSIYNETAAVALTYTTNHHLGGPLAPVDDDQRRFNDATVNRKLGGSQRVTKTTGPLQTTAPPTGIGIYATSLTINCLTEDQAKQRAGWVANNEGTWDDYRYPSITLDMDMLPLTQRAQLMLVNVGARLTLDSPPSWLPPDQIDLLIIGMKEKVSRYRWSIELVCIPFGPYRVGVWDDTTLGRLSPDVATIATAPSPASTGTSMTVAVVSGPLWTTAAASFPFDIRVAGERMTVTNITGGSSPQTFTITRSVNGVVKAQVVGAAVELWQPMIWAE